MTQICSYRAHRAPLFGCAKHYCLNAFAHSCGVVFGAAGGICSHWKSFKNITCWAVTAKKTKDRVSNYSWWNILAEWLREVLFSLWRPKSELNTWRLIPGWRISETLVALFFKSSYDAMKCFCCKYLLLASGRFFFKYNVVFLHVGRLLFPELQLKCVTLPPTEFIKPSDAITEKCRFIYAQLINLIFLSVCLGGRQY